MQCEVLALAFLLYNIQVQATDYRLLIKIHRSQIIFMQTIDHYFLSESQLAVGLLI